MSEFEAGLRLASIDFAACCPHCYYNGRTTPRNINGTVGIKIVIPSQSAMLIQRTTPIKINAGQP